MLQTQKFNLLVTVTPEWEKKSYLTWQRLCPSLTKPSYSVWEELYWKDLQKPVTSMNDTYNASDKKG